jgi:hypothetical protein
MAKILSATLIVLGLIWSVGFPKHGFPARPDFVMSVSVAVGLLGSGALVFALRSKPWPTHLLSLALLWSCLANVTLYAIAHDFARALQHANELSTSRR